MPINLKTAGLMKMVGTKTADYIYSIRAAIYKYATTLVHISSHCMVKSHMQGELLCKSFILARLFCSFMVMETIV